MTNETTERFRLSPRQKYLWQLQRQWRDPTLRCQARIEVEGPLEITRFNHALDLVVARNEILRSGFESVVGMNEPLLTLSSDYKPPFTSREAPEDRWDDIAEEQWTALSQWRHPQVAFLLLSAGPVRHRLLVTASALCLDRASAANLSAELVQAYEGLTFAAESIPFVNFSEWQHEILTEQDTEIGRDYWYKLDLEARADRFPMERSAVAETEFRPETLSWPLTEKCLQVSGSLCASLDQPLAVVVLAGWLSLLRHYTGEADLLLWSRFEGRTDEELAEVMGPLERYLPLPFKVAPAHSFADLVSQVAESLGEAETWQDYFDWERILGNPENPTAPYPVFAFDHVRETPGPLGTGTVFKLAGTRDETDRFKLKCTLVEDGAHVSLELGFDAVRFDLELATDLCRHLTTLLENADPTHAARPMLALDIYDSHQRREVIEKWNATDVDFKRSSFLHVLAEAFRDDRAGELAVVADDGHLTYAELFRRANQLARLLASRGAGPETCVGLCLERSTGLLVSLLGILKAGAVYVPLDPDLPVDRLRFIIEDARIDLAITQTGWQSIFDETATDLIFLDRDPYDDQSEAPLSVALDPRQAAYIIYTSGSTGVPKGVVLAHEAAVNHMLWMDRVFDFSPDDRFLHKAAISFDASVWELTLPLMVGGRVVMARPGGHMDPAYLTDLIVREGLTVIQNVPTMLQTLFGEPGFARVAGLRYLFCAGEALAPGLCHQVSDNGLGRLINMYGPTEAAIDVTYWPCEPAAIAEVVPIGKPLDNTRIYILNEYLRPTPLGVPGQLYIGGANLARGYARRPDLTAEKFIPDPLSGLAGARLYATGDLARILADGNLAFIGRIDHQVKFHGYRIELGEVESAMRDHPHIDHAVVVVRLHLEEPALIGYFVARQKVSKEALRQFLLDRLPPYMVPSGFVPLSSLPVTASGKIDRNRLPDPDFGAERDHAYSAPRNAVEKTLADIWTSVLGVDDIGIDDNYFTLGGDSIRSINIIGKAGEQGLQFSVEDLFGNPTIAQLSRSIDGETGPAVPPLATAPFSLISEADRQLIPDYVEDAYPLTTGQGGLIYHSERLSDVAAYYGVSNRLVEGSLDEALFRQAVARAIANHPMLRTSIHYSGFSEPLQLVHRDVPVPLKVFDLTSLDADEQNREIAESFQRQRFTRFPLDVPPLFRVELFLLDDNTFRVVHTDHHAILDGWSVATLNTELINTYTTLVAGGEPAARQPKALFRDFVALEKQQLDSEVARSFWRNNLAAASPLRLPRELVTGVTAPPESLVKKPGLVHCDLPPALLAKMKRTAKDLGMPLKSLCLATHLRVLALLTGADDIISGLSSNGRLEHEDGERVLGLFLNALPFRLELGDGNETWADLIVRCFKQEQAMVPHRRFPLAAIQQICGMGDLFEISFNYVDFHVYRETKPDLGFKFKDNLHSLTTNFTMLTTFSFHPFEGDAGLDIYYNLDQWSSDQAALAARYYCEVLSAIVANPAAPLADCDLIPAGERALLLQSGNENLPEPQGDIAAMVDAHLAAKADLPALIYSNETLSRQELRVRANRLAHFLIEKGIRRENRVAVCLERSPEMVVGMLAVIKAGGAYVPIDPDFPPERIAYLVKDSDAKLVLTRESLLDRLPETETAVVMDREAEAISARPSSEPALANHPQQLVYVIYTSGSTGRPKGVAITHGALRNYVVGILERCRLDPDATMSMLSTVAADLGNTALWGALCSGRPLQLLPQEMNLNAVALVGELATRPLDCLKVVPSHLQMLLTTAGAETILPRKLLILGGEKLSPSLVERVRAQRPQCRVINHYGPTETTIGVLTHEAGAESGEAGDVPIGKPLPHTSALVLDSRLGLMPLGTVGELCIGGVPLARGYLNAPAATALRFVPSPYGRMPGERIYRTGDLVRQSADGEITYVGRRDHQVKIRGFRVELAEIEHAVKQIDGVRDAVVMPLKGDEGYTGLAAYLATGKKLAPSAISEALGRNLPDYMVPSHYVFLERLPLNANGKIDRAALPGVEATTSQVPYVAPRTDEETQLVAIWKEVLKVDRVGVRDSFFQLGGNSLLAMLVVTRVRDLYKLEVSVQVLFEATTIEELAALVKVLREENELMATVTAEREPSGETEEFTL